MADEELETNSANVSEDQADAPVDLDTAEPGEGSSPAPEGEKFDLLSVVRSAVQDTEDSASPAGQEQEADQPPADASAQTEGKAPDNEDFSDAPFHTHPRFKELIAQRNQYREGAKQYEQIQNFLHVNGVAPEDAAKMLEIQALMKRDPQQAWQHLKPIVQQLLVEAGEVLPADLKQRVQRGEMTQAAAIEMSRLRAQQTSGQRAREMETRFNTEQAEAARIRSIQESVAMWEQNTRIKDPDFAKKYEDIQKEVLWLQKSQGLPKTPEDARKMVETAYATVTKRLAPVRPAKQPVRPVTGGRSASGNATPAPKSMLDVVQAARSQG